ncbi:lysine biosynthesis protein LysX [bacterium]|nr:lysine biosynthesis protein LysX [bacterium]
MAKDLGIAVLCSLVRPEEKMIFDAFRARDVDFQRIDDREVILDLHQMSLPYRIVLERCINHSRALHTLKYYNDREVRTINSYDTANICGDKLLTSLALSKAGIPIPRNLVAYTPESALLAIEQLGYPVVLKPAVGSWGRLLAKINDRDAAEAILEHKKTLGSYHHSTYYIQEFIDSGNQDIRAFVVGGELIGAIYRKADHWITNTARGGKASKVELNTDLKNICEAAARAVLGDIVAIDVFETPQGYLVNEVNYTMEFRNSIAVTGVDIPGKIVDYVIECAG